MGLCYSIATMKKLLFILLFLIFVGITVFAGWKLLPQAVNFSGLQVIANGGEAEIFLDNQKLGKTPYENEKLHPGDYVLRLVPLDKKFKKWEKKITLTTGAMTTVERSFSSGGKFDGGLSVFLQAIDDKMAAVEVITTPDNATLYFDKENKGKTPFTVQNVIAGNHEVIVKEDGYEDKIYKIDTVSGFKISMNFDLIPASAAKSGKSNDKTLGATSASSSAKTTSSPSPSPKTTSGTSKKIEIGETGTGWLRVREEPSTAASESAKVNSGQTFTNLEEQNGWIKIEYQTGKFGWISSDYVKKL